MRWIACKGDGTGEHKDEKKGEAHVAPQPKQAGHDAKPHAQPPDAKPDRAKEFEERLMRLQAEFENYKKRAARENEAVRETASADLLLKLLPVVDDFDIAVAHMDKAAHRDFRQGIELIYVKLRDVLKREGVEEMRALGERFDPYRHDAIRQCEGDEGKVAEVIQKGYTLKGKVLRHAKVAVGTGKAGEAK